jgi:hypothetical protein
MEPMQQNETDREARLRELASKLFFSMENQGGRPQQPVLRCSVGLHVASDLRCSYQQHIAPIDFNHDVVPCNVADNCPLEACGR